MRPMLKLAVAAAIAHSPAVVPAQAAAPFSADLVVTPVFTGRYAAEQKKRLEGVGNAGPAVSRMYVSGLRIRRDSDGGTMLADMAPGGKSYVISAVLEACIEFARDGAPQRVDDLRQYLKGDGDLCAMRPRPDDGLKTSCSKLVTKVIDGRTCQEYELVTAGRKETLCMDAALHFPLRASSDWSIMEMKNIVEGPQPGSLFALPASCSKKALDAPAK